MRKIDLGTSESEQLVSNLRKWDLVILAGSTISCWEPTCLFSGRQFTDAMFKILFPQTFIDDNTEEGKVLKEFFKNVPFEHLLERYPNHERLTDILTRVFSIKEYNPIHEILAKALIDEKIRALITTNYDLCLDEVFNQHNDSQVLRIINEDDVNRNNIENKKLYFKIHGSADKPPSLVFTLTHESILPKWKREILRKNLHEKVLIIIGYSGADFEICPEIEQIPTKQIVWNTLEENFPSNNAKRILNQKSGIQLIGDMKILLSALFKKKIDSPFNPKSDQIDSITSQLPKIDIMEWRSSLLNSIGFPSLSMRASEELLSSLPPGESIDYIRAMRQKAQALFHLGKYKDSSLLFRQAALIANRINENFLEADLLLDVSTSLRNYRIFCLKNYVKIAERIIMMNIRNMDEKKRNRLLGKIFLRKAVQGEFFRLIAKNLKLSFFTQWITRKAKKFLQKAAELSLNAGNWFDFYQIRLLSDRMRIQIDVGSNSNYYEPPPTKDAYTQLGYYIPLSIHVREKLMGRRGSLTEGDENDLKFILERAKITKNFPEIWKILRLGIIRDRKWRKNKEIWKDFFQSFFSCQYTIGMRIFKLMFGG